MLCPCDDGDLRGNGFSRSVQWDLYLDFEDKLDLVDEGMRLNVFVFYLLPLRRLNGFCYFVVFPGSTSCSPRASAKGNYLRQEHLSTRTTQAEKIEICHGRGKDEINNSNR